MGRILRISAMSVAFAATFIILGSRSFSFETEEASVWSIEQPEVNDQYGTDADVACSGSAAEPNYSFVVKIMDNEMTVTESSASGTSTAAKTWSCTVNAPAGGFTARDDAMVVLVVGGDTEDFVCIQFV